MKEGKAVTPQLYVVETTDCEVFLGRLEFEHGTVIIYSGFVGRPPVIPEEDVESIVLAELHPAVVMA